MNQLDQLLEGYTFHRNNNIEPETLKNVFDLSWDDIRTLEHLYIINAQVKEEERRVRKKIII